MLLSATRLRGAHGVQIVRLQIDARAGDDGSPIAMVAEKQRRSGGKVRAAALGAGGPSQQCARIRAARGRAALCAPAQRAATRLHANLRAARGGEGDADMLP